MRARADQLRYRPPCRGSGGGQAEEGGRGKRSSQRGAGDHDARRGGAAQLIAEVGSRVQRAVRRDIGVAQRVERVRRQGRRPREQGRHLHSNSGDDQQPDEPICVPPNGWPNGTKELSWKPSWHRTGMPAAKGPTLQGALRGRSWSSSVHARVIGPVAKWKRGAVTRSPAVRRMLPASPRRRRARRRCRRKHSRHTGRAAPCSWPRPGWA